MAPHLATPAAHPRRGQRGRAERGLDARRAAAREPRPVPRGAAPRRGRRAGRRPSCPSPTRPSTWSRRSTSSSTAPTTRARSPSWRGCSRRAAGCCSRCRPTSGRGRTTTSRPATTGATRARARPAGRGRGMEVLRATYAFGGVFPLFVAERLRRRLLPRPGDTRLPRSRRARPGADGLCRATRACCAAATCPTARRCSSRRQAVAARP